MKAEDSKPTLKILTPYVYTTIDLCDKLRVSYSDILRRIKTKEIYPFSGKDKAGYRFSYFQLPAWIQGLLPVPRAEMIRTGMWKIKKNATRKS